MEQPNGRPQASALSVCVRVMAYFRIHWQLLAVGLLLTGMGIGAELLKPWPLKFIIDSVLVDDAPASGIDQTLLAVLGVEKSALLAILCVGILAIYLGASTLNLVSKYLLVKVSLRVLTQLRCDLFRHLQRLSLRFHDRHRIGDSLYTLNTNSYAIQGIFCDGFMPVLEASVTVIGMVVIMIRMDWQLTLLSVATVPAQVLVTKYYADRIRQASSEFHSAEGNVSASAEGTLSSVRLVQAFAREDYEAEKFSRKCQQSYSSNLRLTMTQLWSGVVVSAVTAGSLGSVTYVGASHAFSGQISTGELIVFLAYLQMLYTPLQTLSYSSWSVGWAVAGAQRVFEILDTPEDIGDMPGAAELKRARGEIEFRDVGFAYGSDRPVLAHLSFTVRPGETVAIVGTSGVGKTTLLSLILRFYDPTAGAILLDGVDIRTVRLRSLREQVSMVLQDPILLGSTVQENIAYGRLTASFEDIVAASKAAGAHDFIMRLPDGYHSEVGERGVRLSVGQRQRIAIARAFLKDAPILILDEPTSALDLRTEATVVDSLERLIHGRTTFVVTHRLSLARQASKVIALNPESLQIADSLDELLRNGPLYQEVYDLRQSPERSVMA
ncbi:MAG TPA: ABC transporter ATP-binding protein [Candidatus Tectomicrobia bacterium]|nr:ABC transporter ATP-binding protein [Candidatus Tectomicrobia bacterium]